jgi:hypothetical protein
MADVSKGVSAARALRVREAVGERLLAAGWSMFAPHPAGVVQAGAFSAPLSGDFSATAVVLPWIDAGGGGLSVLGRIGVDYTPARRITQALVGNASSGVILREPQLALALPGDDAVPRAVVALVDFISEQVPRLMLLADVDVLVELLRGQSADPLDDAAGLPASSLSHEGRAMLLVGALYVAAERYAEAREVLSRPFAFDDDSAGRAQRRLIRQLSRWLESEGSAALPSSPAQWPLVPSRPRAAPTWSQLMSGERGDDAAARQQAIAAVRAAGEGKSREELRSLLTHELAQRDQSMEPVELEQTLDVLVMERAPFGTARIALLGIKALRGLGSSSSPLEKVQERRPEGRELMQPDWMKLPDRAAYPVHTVGGEPTAVTIDPLAHSLLDEVLEATAAQVSRIPVWFSAESDTIIAVHIGTRRVGELHGDVVARYAAPMKAASERDENAWDYATLTRRSRDPRYVLELTPPKRDAD